MNPDTQQIPRNIREELRNLTDAFETNRDVPAGLANAVAKGLLVYAETGDARRAVETKEAYRCAAAMRQQGHSDADILFEAAGLFEAGEVERARDICQDVGESLSRSWNTERDAILALGH